MTVIEEAGAWIVVTPTGERRTFASNAAAWRWIDRQSGEPISRSEAVAEWVFNKELDADG